jgi:Ca2+-transporting ATPase
MPPQAMELIKEQETSMNSSHRESSPFWHTLSVEQAYSRLEATSAGLSNAEAARRLAQYGPNELQAGHRVSPWALLLEQFKNVLIIILLIATVLSAALGHTVEAVAITVIVLFAVLLGFVQEYRAERAIEALRQMAAPTATVLREGREVEIPARDLVPGDVIHLEAGDKIPADVRLVEAVNLQMEEAALTGESVPVEKHTAALDNPELALGDRRNLAYAGTTATYGRGTALVVATAMGTEFGKIAQMLETVETSRTPLQENLDRVGRILALVALIVVAIIVTIGLVRGQSIIEMIVFGIALAVAVVPEALPAVVTISLAIGVQRMVRRHALVRRLPAVETLGSTTVICSDKTGTLTRDEMTAREIFAAGQTIQVTGAGYEPQGQFLRDGQPIQPSAPLQRLLQAATLASDARLVYDEAEGRWHLQGDPTEGALVVAAAKAGLDKTELNGHWPRENEIPFSSETNRMTTLHRGPQGVVAYAKGAPEVILSSCTRQLTERGEQPLDDAGRETILTAARQMAERALRVLAAAEKEGATRADAERDMTFLGLVGMIDPPRPEAKAGVQTCAQAGIKTVMITGDHPVTAQAVARELGIVKTGRVITGPELEALPQEEFEKEVEAIEVYARVSPAHKLRVVTALQKKDHVVAMTGERRE